MTLKSLNALCFLGLLAGCGALKGSERKKSSDQAAVATAGDLGAIATNPAAGSETAVDQDTEGDDGAVDGVCDPKQSPNDLGNTGEDQATDEDEQGEEEREDLENMPQKGKKPNKGKKNKLSLNSELADEESENDDAVYTNCLPPATKTATTTTTTTTTSTSTSTSTNTPTVSFAKDVVPISLASCEGSGCHSGTRPAAGIALDSKAGWVNFFAVSLASIEDGSMPIARDPLTSEQIAILKAWNVAKFPD